MSREAVCWFRRFHKSFITGVGAITLPVFLMAL